MTAARLRILLLVALLSALAAPSAQAATGAVSAPRPGHPRIVFIRCSSIPYPCASHRVVTRRGKLLVGAGGMSRRAKVVFPVRSRAGGRVGVRPVGGRFRTPTRIVVRVPGNAISGPIRVVNPGGRYSNAVRIHVRNPSQRRAGGAAPTGPSAFDGNGMWIWYLSRSEGGDPAAIAAQAAAHGVSTVFVKSADGSGTWSQFSATAVAALKATGLRVCGWQFVYGRDPLGEARAAAAAKDAGADCFVIDAEGAYEGKYAQAQRYMTKLRELVGDDFPVGLTSFPYVDFHPGLPFSVFMAPDGGATFNLPQVYWKTIGDTVDQSLAHTYQWNLPYETAIYPLGQTYDGPRAADVRRFRQLSSAYGARGVSWWVWQYASDSDWNALGVPVDALDRPETLWPTLHAGSGGRVGSKGDLVVWAQQHLAGAGATIAIDGQFGAGTANAVRDFQTADGLSATGEVDAATWPVLLSVTPVAVDWVVRARASAARGARAATASAHGLPPGPNGPASAHLPAKRYEVPPGPRR